MGGHLSGSSYRAQNNLPFRVISFILEIGEGDPDPFSVSAQLNADRIPSSCFLL